jgi:hypothetical protein
MNQTDSSELNTVIKPKRGRKSKKDLMQALNMIPLQQETNMKISINELNDNGLNIKELNENELNENDLNENELNENELNVNDLNENELNENDLNYKNEINENLILKNDVKGVSKKRGRKPKGGKIIQHISTLNNDKKNKPNIILHLKCYLKDLNPNNLLINNIESYNFSNKNDLTYELINNKTNEICTTPVDVINYEQEEDESKDNCKELWKKIKQLENNLHINNISDKKSACFWCSYDFDNPPIYIPKYFIKNSYHVYGCFCSPECATAFLMEENIDSSTKFERYHFINHLYAKIYNYEKNIKPAPNPYYMLDKYYGNLTIQEYRSLFKKERLFLIVDKPLTRVLPELHEDNDDFILNNKIIPSNNYNIKKKLQKKTQNKVNIINEKFGITSNS